MILVNRELSKVSVNWPCVSRRNVAQYTVMKSHLKYQHKLVNLMYIEHALLSIASVQ